MGLPVKHRKKYISHKKRWDKSTIISEADLVKNYALKNKKEIRKVEFLVKKYKTIAKQLNRIQGAAQSPQGSAFLTKLKGQGILNQQAESLDEVLDISVQDFLERRLSNVVYQLKLAKSPSQARQFVVHKHITVNGQVINSPAYLVGVQEMETIAFRPTSDLSNEEHPERQLEQVQVKEVEVEQVEENTVENVEAAVAEDVAADDDLDAEETLEADIDAQEAQEDAAEKKGAKE